MQDVKVSICIACHNQANFLSEAVVSCALQDYSNIEIIILDDASTDFIQNSWVKLLPKVKMFRSEEPSVSGEAFNKSITHATGDIIVLL